MMHMDIESIERCTIAAVSPESVHELPGWLLPIDSSTIGRAHSAVPLSHGASNADPAVIPAIIVQYAQRGMQAKFRLPDVSAYAPMCAALHGMGYRPVFPTLAQLGTVSKMRTVTVQTPADVANAPDEAWVNVFTQGRTPSAQDLQRVSNFYRSAGVVFASMRDAESGVTLAGGAAALSHGWVCVHGVNTLPEYRGQGLAGRVLAGLAEVALQRGLDKVFLQVEEDNTSAQALYRRAGFTTAWKYVYWQLPEIAG
jgi:N-acetylglutamate synthase